MHAVRTGGMPLCACSENRRDPTLLLPAVQTSDAMLSFFFFFFSENWSDATLPVSFCSENKTESKPETKTSSETKTDMPPPSPASSVCSDHSSASLPASLSKSLLVDQPGALSQSVSPLSQPVPPSVSQ